MCQRTILDKLNALLERLKAQQRDLILAMAEYGGMPANSDLRQVSELENVIAAVQAVAAKEADRRRSGSLTAALRHSGWPDGIAVVTTEPGREFYVSSNGDRWHLLFDPETGHSFVRHSGNPASGGHVTDIGLPAFLADGRSAPEHQDLRRIIATLADGELTPMFAAG